MKIISTKNNIVLLTFIFTIFLFPHTTFANPLWYGNIISINGNVAIIEFRGLENKKYFSCNIDTITCIEIPKIPLEVPISSVTSAPKSLIKFPSNSTRHGISPTGNFGFYYTVNTIKKNRVLNIVDNKNNKTYSINENLNFWDLLETQPHVSRFASDDSSLTYMSDRSGFASIYNTPLATISKNNLRGIQITSGVSVGDFIYANNNTILYVANTKADPYNWILYSYNLSTKKKIILAQHLSYDTILHKSGNMIIYTELTPLGTMPVVLTNFEGGKIKEFKGIPSTPEYTKSISYIYKKISNLNTVEMKSINTDTKKHPLIVWLHGGPYRQSSFIRHPYISYGVYDWVLEEAVSNGAYILKIDYPGSYGNGRTFTESIKGGVGTTEMKSIMNTVNLYSKTNNISSVYMLGNSYGGYLALKAMVAYPNKINGGFSINGVTDWTSLLNYYKDSIFNTFFNGLPTSKNKKLYSQSSILKNIKSIKNPLYIIQGESDSTIPKSQAILLRNALDNSHKNSTLIMIPNENHIFLKNSSINTICKSLFEMIKLDATKSCNLEG
ncbi:MAG: prolyl oligopeptidase family serine peptidase [Candidatus Nomurabacteria bacterium]|nr:prolyl oligopeptidase family serine peptidase [Candidatus Nomurabacteria bacterium]